MINYSTLENDKKIDYKELIKMMKFALLIFFVVGLIHVLMIILIY